MKTTPERQQRIDSLFKEFETSDNTNENSEDIFKNVEELIYKALLIKLNLEDSSESQKKSVKNKMQSYMASMNENEPSLADAENLIRSIGTGEYQKAATYFEKLLKYRSKLISQQQSKRAKSPKPLDPLNELLSEAMRINPDLSSSEAISFLKSKINLGVIISYDDESFEYKKKNGRTIFVNFTAIPGRMTRLRKNHSK